MTDPSTEVSDGTLVDRVRQHLRQAILEGHLKPGERIRQEEVAKRLGTSRLPIREALRQLQSEGLVTIRAHAGATVAHLDRAELNEVYLLRERLEPLALAASLPLLGDSDIRALATQVEQMESCGAREIEHFLMLDQEFHLASYREASLPRLLRLISSFWDATQQYRRLYVFRLPRTLATAHLEHRLLLQAIEERNVENSAAILELHIRRTRRALDEHGELFSTAGEEVSPPQESSQPNREARGTVEDSPEPA